MPPRVGLRTGGSSARPVPVALAVWGLGGGTDGGEVRPGFRAGVPQLAVERTRASRTETITPAIARRVSGGYAGVLAIAGG